MMAAAVLAAGCGGYGEVSPKAYEFAKALYSACSRRDGAGLAKIERLVAEAESAGELTSREAGRLADIAEDARGGDWQEAAAAARRMMEDQVRR